MAGFDITFESSGSAGASLSLPISFKVIDVQINGFDVCIGSDGSFLFVNEVNNWVVGPKMGDLSLFFMQNLEVASINLPSLDWQYREGKAPSGDWLVDAALVGVPLKGKLNKAFISI